MVFLIQQPIKLLYRDTGDIPNFSVTKYLNGTICQMCISFRQIGQRLNPGNLHMMMLGASAITESKLDSQCHWAPRVF